MWVSVNVHWVWLCMRVCGCVWENRWEGRSVSRQRTWYGQPLEPLSFLWISAAGQQGLLSWRCCGFCHSHSHTPAQDVFAAAVVFSHSDKRLPLWTPLGWLGTELTQHSWVSQESHLRALAQEGAVMLYKVSPVVWTHHRTDFWTHATGFLLDQLVPLKHTCPPKGV